MNAIPKRGTLDLEQPIYDRIFSAIARKRLPAGAQLIEETLAALFEVSRARIRKVLTRLHQDHLVDLKPNRGAFIAVPSESEVAHVFEARRVIEADLCRQLMTYSSHAERAELSAEISRLAERDTTCGDHAGFHLALARLSGNTILLEFLTGLLRRSALILAVYAKAEDYRMIESGQRHLLELLLEGDGDAMAEALTAHLTRLENGLIIRDVPEMRVDLTRLITV